jgi:2-polyprenyl-3-methyl-5-hydroxy-6-metoxy-1,4-benzoquinol methylase
MIQPLAGAKVLDVGCGAGGLGRRLKELGCGQVYGIECVEEPAAIAAQHYDKVFCAPVEQVDLSPYADFFDFVVCADVIEHLVDPWTALTRLRGVLKDSGWLVASIPNVRHRFVIGELLRGKFEYRSEGILDKTHVRFFTFDTIVKLMADCRLTIEQIGPQYNADAEQVLGQWKQQNLPVLMEELIYSFTGRRQQIREDELMDFFSIQFLLRARKTVNA